ncbi:MAG: hypothetical protein LBM09_01510 [Candidatus Nomurabacteria bacterium]|jgi:hypothetical protein|nr:hypothetical protein [Candidatus Nomurabacteria bacterium]
MEKRIPEVCLGCNNYDLDCNLAPMYGVIPTLKNSSFNDKNPSVADAMDSEIYEKMRLCSDDNKNDYNARYITSKNLAKVVSRTMTILIEMPDRAEKSQKEAEDIRAKFAKLESLES